MAIIDDRPQERVQKAPNTSQPVVELKEGSGQASGSRDLETMIEERMAERRRKRQQAEERQSVQADSEEVLVDTPISDNGAHQSQDVDLNDQLASDVGDAGLSNDSGTKEPLTGSRESVDGLDQDGGDTATNDVKHTAGEPASEQVDQVPQTTPTTTHHSMTPQETKWWAMTFEELYQHARRKNFGKTGKEGRKSGRVCIIKWLCKKEGITPYVAPSITPVEATPIIARPTLRPTGAISHPEAILRTSDPAMQRLIDAAEKDYKTWPAADLLALAMQRSYQLLKDSNGKLPSKSISAMANWLAAWDVLKSPREKRWWLGDGIDLVNKAKAMGYEGPSRKYEVIVWLRSTPENAEAKVTEVAQPTPNKNPLKRKAEAVPQRVSKRPAKGSKRPRRWGIY
jgi:hypothetical protein